MGAALGQSSAACATTPPSPTSPLAEEEGGEGPCGRTRAT